MKLTPAKPAPPLPPGGDVPERLARIEALLACLVERQAVREWYTVEEFAAAVGLAVYTVREHCRLGRLRAEKKGSGRGKHQAWALSHAELERYRREGLRPGRSWPHTEPRADSWGFRSSRD